LIGELFSEGKEVVAASRGRDGYFYRPGRDGLSGDLISMNFF